VPVAFAAGIFEVKAPDSVLRDIAKIAFPFGKIPLDLLLFNVNFETARLLKLNRSAAFQFHAVAPKPWDLNA